MAIHHDPTCRSLAPVFRRRRARSFRSNLIFPVAALLLLAAGCSVSQKKVVKPSEAPAPLLTATKDDLIAQYNKQAESVNSLNVSVSMKLTAGSAYSGVIENYHEVEGFILAAKPASIRVIGQAPVVGKNVFDMVSDGQTFRIFIPSKGKFLVGPANLTRPAKKPIENLRPQHLFTSLLWEAIPQGQIVWLEEAEECGSHYYVLSLLEMDRATLFGRRVILSESVEIAQKIWFDRTNLSIVRVETFAGKGKLVSDAHYSAWQPAGDTNYPREITIARPSDDYELRIALKKVALNESIAPDRFQLTQPSGTELVDLAAESKDSKESQHSEPKPSEAEK